MRTTPEILAILWGTQKGLRVAQDYSSVWNSHPDALADLAVFCNSCAPIQGATEFERGVEEGKRRVWLHIAFAAQLGPADFLSLSLGRGVNNAS